jgi:hypothetical protein
MTEEKWSTRMHEICENMGDRIAEIAAEKAENENDHLNVAEMYQKILGDIPKSFQPTTKRRDQSRICEWRAYDHQLDFMDTSLSAATQYALGGDLEKARSLYCQAWEIFVRKRTGTPHPSRGRCAVPIGYDKDHQKIMLNKLAGCLETLAQEEEN